MLDKPCADLLPRVQQAIDLRKTDAPSAFTEFQTLSDQGSPDAMLQLAWCYQVGAGTGRDSTQADKWYRCAYEMGSEDIKQDVRLYRAIATEKSEPANAFAELATLSHEGHPPSMVRLAHCYQYGIGTHPDIVLAEAWYRRAFEAGSGRAKRRALYYLGRLYLVQNDFHKARDMFAVGAELNDPPALYQLGRLYWFGRGLKSQPSEARVLFERASKLGHLLARRNLAIMLLSGRFGVFNFVKGLCMFPGTMLKGMVVAYRSFDLDIPDERLM